MKIHKFYQADVSGKVTTAHHVDEKNVINELRRILNDIATTFGQTRLGDGLYPRDDLPGLEFDVNRITTKTEMGLLTVLECGFVDVSAAAATYSLFLPTAVGNAGKCFIFLKSDANPTLITLDGSGGETIDGELIYEGLNYQYACVVLKSNGTEWLIVGRTIKNVTDDVQLKRADGDIDSFDEKGSPVDDDIVLIEDSAAAYAKKKITVSSLLAAPSAITEMGKVLAFSYDGNGDVQPAEDPGPMDVYFERDANNDLRPIEDLKIPNTINFFFEIETNGDIKPREV